MLDKSILSDSLTDFKAIIKIKHPVEQSAFLTFIIGVLPDISDICAGAPSLIFGAEGVITEDTDRETSG